MSKQPYPPTYHFYLFPWTYYGWCHQIPVLHVWRFHVCVYRMGRGHDKRGWLPNVSITFDCTPREF